MRRSSLLAVLPLALVLSGCFQIVSTLTVRADGSAQIVEQITAEGAMAMGLMAMDDLPMSGEASFGARARGMGEGVTVASVDEAYTAGAVTYTVTYDVADVNALAYSLKGAVNPEAVGTGMMGSTEMPGLEGAEPCDPDLEDCEGTRTEGADLPVAEIEDPYAFAFTPAAGGQPATLRITVPDSAAVSLDDFDLASLSQTDVEDEEQEFNLALVLLGTMAMRFDIVVEGDLVEADRGWDDGDRVTLADVQMGELLAFARDQMGTGDLDAFVKAQAAAGDLDVPGLRAVAPGMVTLQFE